MSGALNRYTQAVAEQLRAAGLNAVTAMDSARAGRWREPVAAVGLSRVVCAQGGLNDYLGVYTDPDTGAQREMYGREAELTLALDIFAPRDAGAAACRELTERAAECLICQGAAGLNVLEVQAGQVEFLERDGLYRQQAACRCRAWLAARLDDEGGTFVDFEVKGRMK